MAKTPKRTTVKAEQTKGTTMWHIRINRASWPADTVGNVMVYGNYGAERRFLASATVVGGLVRGKDGLPDPFTVLEGEWPSVPGAKGDERITLQADSIEADIDFDQDFNVNATITADKAAVKAGGNSTRQ